MFLTGIGLSKIRLSTPITNRKRSNHNGCLDTALETIRGAKGASADCIKLQTYTGDTMTIDCDKEDFLIKVFGKDETYTNYIKRLTTLENGIKLYLNSLKVMVNLFLLSF